MYSKRQTFPGKDDNESSKIVFMKTDASLHGWGARVGNKWLVKYYSPVPDERAEGIDAFLQCWDEKFLYMYPPTKVLRKVLEKFKMSHLCQAILIAPLWPQKPWFPELLVVGRGTQPSAPNKTPPVVS